MKLVDAMNASMTLMTAMILCLRIIVLGTPSRAELVCEDFVGVPPVVTQPLI